MGRHRAAGEAPAAALVGHLETWRTPYGGYSPSGGADHRTAYGCFLALGAYEDLGVPLPAPDRLVDSLAALRAADGGYGNRPGSPAGLTPPTAAAVTVQRRLARPAEPEAVAWLRARHVPAGGFRASAAAPVPDLLSTATALHALAGAHAPLEPLREPCLDFVDSLWTNSGGFYGQLGRRRAGLRVHVLRPARTGAPEPVSVRSDPPAADAGSVLAVADPRAPDELGERHAVLERITDRVLAARTPDGHWTGELSSSALSTATATIALALVGLSRPCPALDALVRDGVGWLVGNANADGGWGDTTDSPSNVSTTALCWAALAIAGCDKPECRAARERARDWMRRAAGSLEPRPLARTITLRYGKDRTFSVPILTVLALAGLLKTDEPGERVPAGGPSGGGGRIGSGWRHVPQLPFELAAVPPAFYRWLRLPVVSYALPALIAIGQARHRQRPTRNPLARLVRRAARIRTLRRLEAIQPRGGGFLEAAPLTSFVVMSLVAAGEAAHPVVDRGVEFLERSVRADGSWPIDTNLATWATTLSVNALARRRDWRERIGPGGCAALRRWLLDQQYRERHVYTDAAPGGWAWTDLPGEYRTLTTRRERCSRSMRSAPTIPSTAKRPAPGSVGSSTCRTRTAGSPHSAAAGERCRSIAAAPT